MTRIRAPLLLRIDSAAGLIAGVAMLVLDEWLRVVYALPLELYRFVVFANLAYGFFSLWLVTSSRRSLRLVHLLVCGNGAWALTCFGLAAVYWEVASVWGLAHLTLEGAFVGALAVLEWRRRDNLSR